MQNVPFSGFLILYLMQENGKKCVKTAEYDMKINFIIPFKRLSGGIRVVFIYAEYLVAKGHDVCCYLPAISYKGKEQSTLFRIKASLGNTIKHEDWFDCSFPVKVVPKINNVFIRDADVSIATAWQTAYDVIKLDKKKGEKYYFVQGLETYNGDETTINKSFALGMHIITISNALKKYINQFSDDVNVVYNGLFDEEFIIGEKEKNSCFSIMVLSHEEPTKGTEEGICVINDLRKEYGNVEGILFGRRIKEIYPAYISTYQNPSRDLLLQLYRKADIYLFTSQNDAWGLTAAEAMAQKCAVIGRKIGIIDELYNGENFVVVHDYNEMLKTAKELYESSSLLKQYQDEGYKTALNLKWERSAERFLDIISKSL